MQVSEGSTDGFCELILREEPVTLWFTERFAVDRLSLDAAFGK